MTAAAIRAAYQRLYPGEPIHPDTFQALDAEDERDRRDHLAELGAEALPEQPVRDQLAQMVNELRALRASPETGRRSRRQVDPSKLLLSKAEAARLLGCDLRTTLDGYIRDKHIRAVKAPHGERIPRSEIDRLLRDGLPPTDAAPRARPPPAPPAPGVGARIRALKIP